MVLKNNVIEDFQKETENNLNIIKEEMKNFKGKSIDIEKKINGLIDSLSKGDKMNDLNKIYNQINESYLNILKDIGELKYDKKKSIWTIIIKIYSMIKCLIIISKIISIIIKT